MNLKRTTLLAAGMSLMSGVVLPSESDAAWRRESSSGCEAARGDGSFRTDSSGYRVNHLGHIVIDDREMQVMCPIEDTSEFPKGDIEQINVHTEDGSNSAGNYSRAYACTVDPFGVGSWCGAGQGAPGSGNKTLTLSTSAEIDMIQDPMAFGFFATIKVYMEAGHLNSQRFYGYWITD